VGLQFHELTTSPAHRVLLRRFYDDAYAPEFPDPDERESLGNIERYLDLKAQGWYGDNAYHVTVAEDAGAVVGGAIADYLAAPNAGVVEFLVVTPAARGRGLGGRLLDVTEAAIAADARRVGRPGADFVIAEINDPFRVDLGADNLDPFLRARVWSGWGYRKLDFPYVQPALSDAQQPVRHLMLAVKPVAAAYAETIPASRVLTTLHEYLRWAMRIPNPDQNADYRAMRGHLARRDSIASIPLARYVGRDAPSAIAVREIEGEGPDLDAALAVYGDAFPPGPTSLPADALRRAAAERQAEPPDVRYHLWALCDPADARVGGMASFYSLPGVGVGGYVALDASLRGRGRLRSIVARIEEQMRRDDTGARGWLIECAPGGTALTVFRRLGFREIALDYRQPPLDPGRGEAPRLALAYKEFGAVYDDPAVDRDDVKRFIRTMFATVYAIDVRKEHRLVAALDAQIDAWPTRAVEWRRAAV